MIDRHGRSITYLRLSVTDHRDLRCAYCMPERMEFLPRSEISGLEAAIARAVHRKPLAHDFRIAPAQTHGLERHMSVTGG